MATNIEARMQKSLWSTSQAVLKCWAITVLILLAASAATSAGTSRRHNGPRTPSACTPPGDNIAYTVTSSNQSISNQFGTVDLNSGTFCLLGPTQIGNTNIPLAGMAVLNSTLYGVDYEFGSQYTAGTLYTINPTNGNLTVPPLSSSSGISYYMFGSTTSGLFAVDAKFDGTASLYSIDPATGAATKIGSGIGVVLSTGNFSSLSNNSSTLYFSNGPNLYTIDTGSGAATFVADMGSFNPQMGGMVFEGGILYGAQDSPTPLSVDTIDPTTGVATIGPNFVGTTNNIFGGLAPYLPTTAVTLDASTTPSGGDPGATNMSVTGNGFPNGTISPANVTVSLNPTVVGGGPSGTTVASAVTVISGSRERVTFKIPTSIAVSSPTSYQVSIAGTTNTGNAFQSSNTASTTVNPLLAITTSSPLPSGTVGVNYSQALTATGGNGIYTWAITKGGLPAGLSLNSATGEISGLPTAAGTSHFTISVTDSLGAASAKAFTLTVNTAPQITTVSPNWGRVGQTLQATITGAHTHFLQGSTLASFGAGISVGGAAVGQPGPVTVNSPTRATAQLAISATASMGAQTVTVTTGSEQASLVNGFTIFPAVPTLTILHTFAGGSSDGSGPEAPVVIGSGGVLYGTTFYGGTANFGTVFSVTPPPSQGGSWTETTLHQFGGATGDGASPLAGLLIGSGGVLYSTTERGGNGTGQGCFSLGCGAVFSLTPPTSQGGSWTESLPYQFSGLPGDGFDPDAGLVMDSNGVLYGTTGNGGGPSGAGTVFSLTPPATQGGSWTETILHTFTGGSSDGAAPFAPVVIGSGGVLYGTTFYGGPSVGGCSVGCGTVFSLTPPATQGGSWTETILHTFTAGSSDGAHPYAPVVIGSGGVLYGTAATATNKGTVFSLTPPATQGGSWTETILHTFPAGSGDGTLPDAPVVIGAGGVLYSTTGLGGTSNKGTVFSLTPPATQGGSWTETILHTFTGGSSDGAYPRTPVVIDSTGLLYGTTFVGGSSNQGTVFLLTP